MDSLVLILMEYFSVVHCTERICSILLYCLSSRFLEWWRHQDPGRSTCDGCQDKLRVASALRCWISSIFHWYTNSYLLLKNRTMVFPLPCAEVSCGGERCTFRVKGTFFARYFASSADKFTRGLENWKATRAWCCGLFKKKKVKKIKEGWLENIMFIPGKLHHFLLLQHRTQMGPRQQYSSIASGTCH